MEEDERLGDPAVRENFIERVFAFWRLSGLFATRWSLGGLVAFHTAHKLTLMAHSPAAYRELGQLVAAAKAQPRAEFADRSEHLRGIFRVLHHQALGDLEVEQTGVDIGAGAQAIEQAGKVAIDDNEWPKIREAIDNAFSEIKKHEEKGVES